MTALRKWRRGLLPLGCLALLWAAPSAATAGVRRVPISAGELACPAVGREASVAYYCAEEFKLRGTGGYTIAVSADPEGGHDKDRDGEVTLYAEAPDAGAQYMVKGKVTPNSIDARIGKLGRIAVHFVPSGRERTVRIPKTCLKGRPKKVTARLGRFVGTIDFHGELGYTKVDARSAEGGIGDPLAVRGGRLECEFRQSKAEHKRQQEAVSLQGSPREGLAFGVAGIFGELPGLGTKVKHLPPAGKRLIFQVFGDEKKGGMTIFRTAGAVGESADLTYDDSLTTATVSAPAEGPFSGSADFVRAADGSTSLTGDFAVDLPGLGTVPLAGGESELATEAAFQKQLEEKLGGKLKN